MDENFGAGKKPKPRGPYGTNEGDKWLSPGSPVQDRFDARGEGEILVHEMMDKDGKVQECLYVLIRSNEDTRELLEEAERGHELYMAERASRN